MEVISTVALISINATLAAQLVSFLIFLFIINRLMFRPLQDTMEQRERQMEDMEKEIETADAEMKKIFATLEKEETKAKKDAFAIEHKLEQEGNQHAEAVFKEASAEIEKLKAQTRQEVEGQIFDVRQHLAQESEKLSRAIMEKALDRSFSHE
jgi:F-type H+-transporting ATPase subunit b